MPHIYFRPGVDDFAFSNHWTLTDFERSEVERILVVGIQPAIDAIGEELRRVLSPEGQDRLEAAVVGILEEAEAILGVDLVEELESQVRGWLDALVVQNSPATFGLCGGMAFAALDYFRFNHWIPRGAFAQGQPNADTTERGATLRGYIWERLIDSLEADGPRFLLWMAILHGGGAQGTRALAFLTRLEFAKICHTIDLGSPWPLGLVGTTTAPQNNHQVLAYGYDLRGDWGTLYVYDSNAPGRESIVRIKLRGGSLDAYESQPSAVRGPLRGFFASTWAIARPPAIEGHPLEQLVWMVRFGDAGGHYPAWGPIDRRDAGQGASIDCGDGPVHQMAAGDFDGDGVDELVVACARDGARGNRLQAFKYTGRDGFAHLGLGATIGWDVVCNTRGSSVRALAAGDVDGDGRDELIVLPRANPGQQSAALWVLRYEPETSSWTHVSPDEHHPFGADLVCFDGLTEARFALVGDFDKSDGAPGLQIAVAAAGPLSTGNDFWVMRYRPRTRSWHRVGEIPNHPLRASIDLSETNLCAKMAAVGRFYDEEGNDQLVIVPHTWGSEANDLWVANYNGTLGTWEHSRVDLTPSDLVHVQHVACGDVDGDGRDEIIVLAEAKGSAGNDIWVMDWVPDRGEWRHLSPITGHPFHADIDVTTSEREGLALLVADFDGDGWDEVALVPRENLAAPNDMWVLKFDRARLPVWWNPLGQFTYETRPGVLGNPLNTSLRVSATVRGPVRVAVAGRFEPPGQRRPRHLIAGRAGGRALVAARERAAGSRWSPSGRPSCRSWRASGFRCSWVSPSRRFTTLASWRRAPGGRPGSLPVRGAAVEIPPMRGQISADPQGHLQALSRSEHELGIQQDRTHPSRVNLDGRWSGGVARNGAGPRWSVERLLRAFRVRSGFSGLPGPRGRHDHRRNGDLRSGRCGSGLWDVRWEDHPRRVL
jgi:hypothetical protein